MTKQERTGIGNPASFLKDFQPIVIEAGSALHLSPLVWKPDEDVNKSWDSVRV